MDLMFRLYIDQQKVTKEVRQHLCDKSKPREICVEIKDYNYTILRNDIQEMANSTTQSIWVNN